MTRTYEFVLTVEVDEHHVAFDNPEWVADAEWGTLTNEYGLVCTYGRVDLVKDDASGGSLPPSSSTSEE